MKPIHWIVVVMALAFGSYGYYQFVYYPTTPQYAVGRIIEARQVKNYEAVYDMVKVPTTLKLLVPNGKSLAGFAESQPNMFPDVLDYRFGNVSQDGEAATVETFVTVRHPASGKPEASNVSIHMVKEAGKWKLDGAWLVQEITSRGADVFKSALF